MVTEAPPKPPASLPLLTWWIERRRDSYVEPERTGTPPGEVVGFSRKKYHAALLTLTTDPLVFQAKRVGVSYNVLRKWRSEPAFKSQVEDLAARFVGVVRHVVAPAAQAGPSCMAYVWDDGTPVFGDAKLYGPLVLEALGRLRDSEPDEDMQLALAGVWFELCARVLDETDEGQAVMLGQLRSQWWKAAGGLVDTVLDHLDSADVDAADGRDVPTRDEASRVARLLRAAIAGRRVLELREDARARRSGTTAAAVVHRPDAASSNGHRVVVPPPLDDGGG